MILRIFIMNYFTKLISLLFIPLFLFMPYQQASAESFKDICNGNGEYLENVKVTTVAIMGAEHERRAFFFLNGNTKDYRAEKNYESDLPSDRFLIESMIKAQTMNFTVDLCITGNKHELYGINLK